MGMIYKTLILLSVLWSPVVFAKGAILEAIGGSGVVSVKREGKAIKLRAGDALVSGDEVVTDATTAADIRLEDKTLLRVGASSSYKLENSSLFHQLLSGLVRVLVPKEETKSGNIRFRLQTPEGTIGVRGTEFVVIRTQGETVLKGLEGEVLFGPSGGNFDSPEFVVVKKGFESSIRSGNKNPLAPKAFPLAPYLKGLDDKNGKFGSLAFRKNEKFKRRGNPAARVADRPAAREEKKSEVNLDSAKVKPKTKFSEDINDKLFAAASKGDLKAAGQALEKGAEVNSKQVDGNTALHAAAVESKYEMMKFLLEKGARVDSKNDEGQTPLMVVAKETADAAAALLLLDAKASLSEKDNEGLTALDIANIQAAKEKEKYDEILKIFHDREN